MNQVLQAALNLLDIIENNRSDLREELNQIEWQDLMGRLERAQRNFEVVKDQIERGNATESDLTNIANEVIEDLTKSEVVRKLMESLRRIVASKSERSYVIAGLASEKKDRVKPTSEELMAFTNRMIKRCEIIRSTRG